MPDSRYLINRDPSGRATCQGSKEKISKGELRMSVHTDMGEMIFTKHWKLDYFKIPRKFGKISIDDFVENEVTINEQDDIELEEVLKLMKAASDKKSPKKKKGAKKEGGDDDEATTLMGKIKAAAEASEDEPKAKKVKTELPADFDQLVQAYKTLMKKKRTVEVLKDYLRWNKQVLVGKRDFVIFKILDGKVNGRLGYCSLDGSKLKLLEEDPETVVGMGYFDEESHVRIPSSFKASRLDASVQRLKWFDQAPTEEEKKEMEQLEEDAKAMRGGVVSGASGGEGSGLRQELLDAAENIDDWDLTKANKATMKKYLTAFKAIGEGKIGFPEGNRANQEVGKLFVQNRSASAKEIMEMIIDKYGLVELNEKKEAVKEEAFAEACACPENGKIVAAFEELAALYFKEGNTNAGGTYKKVSAALKGLEVEITAANAMSFSKGKTKIAGIGPSSAKKMKEFAETGTMEKLEEKRKLSSS